MNDLQYYYWSSVDSLHIRSQTILEPCTCIINSTPNVFLSNWSWMWVNNGWVPQMVGDPQVQLHFHQNCLNSYVVLHIPGKSFLFSLLKNPGCDSSSFTTTLPSSLTSSTSAVDCFSSIASNGHVSCSKIFNNLSWK